MPRRTLALLLLVAAAGLLWWAIGHRDYAREPPTGDFDVYVVGPSSLLHNGTVFVERANELRVLQALGARDGFAVEADDLSGCSYDYVRGVAGYGETATGGWNYYLRRGGEWTWQGRSASCPGLREGDDVLWCWVEPDERCAVYP